MSKLLLSFFVFPHSGQDLLLGWYLNSPMIRTVTPVTEIRTTMKWAVDTVDKINETHEISF